MRTIIKGHFPFFILLVIIAFFRFYMLFVSQTHVHSDEAIIGLMAKHISEGLFFPVYMYGQVYNAGAVIEACFAALSFILFGVSPVALKGCIVIISLVTLTVFYFIVARFWNKKIALLSSLLFSFFPSLLKWHFQVRGYSPYFLMIVLLWGLFLSIKNNPRPSGKKIFVFGLVTGFSLWILELILSVCGFMWLILFFKRRIFSKGCLLAVSGFLTGYFPCILFNLTNHFVNWKMVFMDKVSLPLESFFMISTWGKILFREMPKFFGTDTVLWYYPEINMEGIVGCCFFLVSLLVGMIQIFRNDQKNEHREYFFLILLLIACFIPYISTSFRVPGYFLGSAVFLSVLTGSVCYELLEKNNLLNKIAFFSLLLIFMGLSLYNIVKISSENIIETLTLDRKGAAMLGRFPGKDISETMSYLKQNGIEETWTTPSFVYPLIFESQEKLKACSAIFGSNFDCYPEGIPSKVTPPRSPATYIVESESPYYSAIIHHYKNKKDLLRISRFGSLTVVSTITKSP